MALADTAIEYSTIPDRSQNIVREELSMLLEIVAKSGLEFGFRTIKEVSRFIGLGVPLTNALSLGSDDEGIYYFLDFCVLQKILPRLSGSRKQLQPIIEALLSLLTEQRQLDAAGLTNRADILASALGASTENTGSDSFPNSVNKLLRMRERLIATGFTSFAEA